MGTYKTTEMASRGESYAVESTPWFSRYVSSLPPEFQPLAATGLRGVYSAASELGGARAFARWGRLFVENSQDGAVLNPDIVEDFTDTGKTRVYEDLRGSAAVVLLATGGAAIFRHPGSRKLAGKQIARFSTTNSTVTALAEASRWEPEGTVKLPTNSMVSRVSVQWHQDVSRPGFSPDADVAIRYTNNDLSILQIRENGLTAAQYLDCSLTSVEDDFITEVNLSQRSGPSTLQAIGNTLLIVADRSAATI